MSDSDAIPTDLPIEERRRLFREKSNAARAARQAEKAKKPEEPSLRLVSERPFPENFYRHLAEREKDPEGFDRREREEQEARRQKEEADARLERRRRILHAVIGSPDAVEALATSLDAPPVVEGHAGSIAAAREVVRFLREPRILTLLLWGPTGHGKSWAAAWAVADRGVFVADADIRPGDVWDDKREKAMQASLVVFDELGRRPADKSDWNTLEAAALIEHRQTRGLRTIITTNVPPRRTDLQPREAWAGQTIAERYGDRLIDRLADARHGLIVRIQGKTSIRAMQEGR